MRAHGAAHPGEMEMKQAAWCRRHGFRLFGFGVPWMASVSKEDFRFAAMVCRSTAVGRCWVGRLFIGVVKPDGDSASLCFNKAHDWIGFKPSQDVEVHHKV